jgi:hypothetical protein
MSLLQLDPTRSIAWAYPILCADDWSTHAPMSSVETAIGTILDIVILTPSFVGFHRFRC